MANKNGIPVGAIVLGQVNARAFSTGSIGFSGKIIDSNGDKWQVTAAVLIGSKPAPKAEAKKTDKKHAAK